MKFKVKDGKLFYGILNLNISELDPTLTQKT
jgi:hypothetical protein